MNKERVERRAAQHKRTITLCLVSVAFCLFAIFWSVYALWEFHVEGTELSRMFVSVAMAVLLIIVAAPNALRAYREYKVLRALRARYSTDQKEKQYE